MKMTVLMLLVCSIGCGAGTTIASPTPIPVVTTAAPAPTPTPAVPTPVPVSTPTIASIVVHVIATNGNAIQAVEVSADGKFYGVTDKAGSLSVTLDLEHAYAFTLYHGQYRTSYETHTVHAGDAGFTSTLTRLP